MKEAKRILSLCLALVLCFALVACGAPAAPAATAAPAADPAAEAPAADPAAEKEVYPLIITHCQPYDDPFHMCYLEVEKFLEESGRFDVTIFANQEFSASEAECANQVMNNIAQISQGPSYQIAASAGVREYYIYDYPFLFEDTAEYHVLLESDIAKELAARVRENSGLIVATGWVNGWMATGNAKHPLNTVEDMRNLKLRSPQTETCLAYMAALGVNAIPMAFSEIYTGIQQGTIDGVVTPLRFFNTMKFGEVAPYVMWDRSSAVVQLPYTNETYFNSLDEEAQGILMEGLELYCVLMETSAADAENASIDILKKDMDIDVVIPSEEVMEEFRAAGAEVLELKKDIVGEEFAVKVLELLGK